MNSTPSQLGRSLERLAQSTGGYERTPKVQSRQTAAEMRASVWSARSLLPLSDACARSKAPASRTHSKRFASLHAGTLAVRLEAISVLLALTLGLMAASPAPAAENTNTPAEAGTAIDAETLRAWSAPFRNWQYWPEHVIPATPPIPGVTNIVGTDVPSIYQIPGDEKWYLSFVGFDGTGYQSYVAESTDLLHWGNYRLAMGYGPVGEFDYGGRVIGGYLYESYELKAPRVLKKRDGKFCTLYGAYPRQGGYELRPGSEGLAMSEDGLTWKRAKDQPVLSIADPDCGTWEQSCVYQPWLLEHQGRFFDFYNAAKGSREQTGVAFSCDLLNWMRYPANPVVRNRPGGYDQGFCSDPKVFRDGDHWTMIYFGVGRGSAHIMAAFSRDLVHWTADPEPLYKGGGNPSGLDKQYAHKIALVYNPKNDTFYMFYDAVPGKKGAVTGGRGIGLITSKPLR